MAGKIHSDPGDGAGGGWQLLVDIPGSSFAGFTAHTGTWASSGGVIQQTLTGAVVRRARYDTRLDTVELVAQVDVRFPTGGAATRSAGIIIGWPGTDVANYPLVQLLFDATDKFQLSQDALSNILDETVTVNADTWYTIRAHVSGRSISGYLDGVLKGTMHHDGDITDYLSHFIGLRAFDATVEFRNLKIWVITLP